MTEILSKILKIILDQIFNKPTSSTYSPSRPIDESTKPTKIKVMSTDITEFACKCGCQVNTKIVLDPALKSILEYLETLYKGTIHIDSGHRCVTHNKKVGGAVNSQHLNIPINTADLRVEGISAKQVYMSLDNHFSVGGLGYYLNNKTGWEFIHVDTRPEIKRWLRIDYKYLPASPANTAKYGLVILPN